MSIFEALLLLAVTVTFNIVSVTAAPPQQLVYRPLIDTFNHTIGGILNCTNTGNLSHVCSVPCAPGQGANITEMNSTCNFMAGFSLTNIADIQVNVSRLTGYQLNCSDKGCNISCGAKNSTTCKLPKTNDTMALTNITEFMLPPYQRDLKLNCTNKFLANALGEFDSWFYQL